MKNAPTKDGAFFLCRPTRRRPGVALFKVHAVFCGDGLQVLFDCVGIIQVHGVVERAFKDERNGVRVGIFIRPFDVGFAQIVVGDAVSRQGRGVFRLFGRIFSAVGIQGDIVEQAVTVQISNDFVHEPLISLFYLLSEIGHIMQSFRLFDCTLVDWMLSVSQYVKTFCDISPDGV